MHTSISSAHKQIIILLRIILEDHVEREASKTIARDISYCDNS